jgi:hypothetical protein
MTFFGIEAPIVMALRLQLKNRDSELLTILKGDSWIIEGVYYSWLMKSFKVSDLIVVLQTSMLLRDLNIIRRFIIRELGILRSKEESLRDFWRLIKWNHDYDKNNLRPALDFISDFKEKTVVYETYDQILQQIRIRDIICQSSRQAGQRASLI